MEILIPALYTASMLIARTVYCTNRRVSGVNAEDKAQPALPGNLYQIPAPQRADLKCSAGTSSFNSLQSLDLTEKEKRSTSGPY